MNNTFYPPNDYRNYLAHHGVKGMKWGVRRYQNADGSFTREGRARANRDGKGFIPRMKMRGQGLVGGYAEWGRGIKNAKGLRKVSAAVGSGAAASHFRNTAYTQARLAEASKTRLGRHLHNVASYNNAAFARKAERMHNAKNAGEWVRRFIADTPQKSIAGRKTSSYAQQIDRTLTGGTLGTIADAAYLYGRYKKSRNGNGSRKRKKR